jgi:hypothetical protein
MRYSGYSVKHSYSDQLSLSFETAARSLKMNIFHMAVPGIDIR